MTEVTAIPEPSPTENTAGHRDAWPGSEAPLGATWGGEGTNFAVYSASAEAVEVVLFDEWRRDRHVRAPGAHRPRLARIRRPGPPGPALRLHVRGPYDPLDGLRHNPRNAAPIPTRSRSPDASSTARHCTATRSTATISRQTLDSAPAMPKSVVVDKSFPGATTAGRTRRGLTR